MGLLLWRSVQPTRTNTPHVLRTSTQRLIRTRSSQYRKRSSPWKRGQLGTVELKSDSSASTPFNLKDSQWPEKARHNLRAILRECTYLPDPYARRYLSQYAVGRFREYSWKAWEHRNDPDFEDRLRKKHTEAQKAVSQLQRASEGERKPLLRMLLKSYGRIGKRRRELLVPLLPRPDDKASEKALSEGNMPGPNDPRRKTTLYEHSAEFKAAFQTATSELCTNRLDQDRPSHPKIPSGNRNTQYLTVRGGLTPALFALAKSQMLVSPPDLTRPNPRHLNPQIPKLNSWLRPMPRKRVKNLIQKWYAHILSRVHPPLPTDEWARLRDLAAGRNMPDFLLRRRKPGVCVFSPAPNKSSALEMVVADRRVRNKVFSNPDAHNITARFMQRLWAQVFAQCPRMDWDDEKKEWNLTWGERALYCRKQAPGHPEGASTAIRASPISQAAGDLNEGFKTISAGP